MKLNSELQLVEHWKIDNSIQRYPFCHTNPRGYFGKGCPKREEELNRNYEERIIVVYKGGLKNKDIIAKKKPFTKLQCVQKNAPCVQIVNLLV